MGIELIPSETDEEKRKRQLEYGREHYRRNADRYRAAANGRMALRRERNQQWMVNYMAGKSCPCGVSDPRLLAFDHIDPTEKRRNIADIVSKGLGLDKLKEEIAKCRILCHNCHMLHTINQMGGSYHDRLTPITDEDFNSKYGE